MADGIESENTVGYMEKSMNVGGFTMNAASFASVGQNGLRLTSFVPRGYEANEDIIDAEGTAGEFNIQILTKLGRTDKTYAWVRSYDADAGEWNDDGHWTYNGATVVPGSANDPIFNAGTGLWTAAPDWAGDDDTDYTVTDAGEVKKDSVTWLFNIGGFTPCGNPFPVGVRLSSLIPQGYEANEDIIDAEGTAGEFNIQILTKLGRTEKTYAWVRSYDADAGEWNDDGHWTYNGATVVPGSANDPIIAPGQGLWIAAPDWAGDDNAVYSMTVNYPAN